MVDKSMVGESRVDEGTVVEHRVGDGKVGDDRIIGSCLGSVKATFCVLARPQPCAVVASPHESHVPCPELRLNVSAESRPFSVELVPTPFTTDDHKVTDVLRPFLRLSWAMMG